MTNNVGMSDQFCGPNQLICSGTIILQVITGLFYAFYYKQIKQKLRKQQHPLNVRFKSGTFITKVTLMVLIAVDAMLGILLIVYSTQKVYLYNLVILSFDIIMILAFISMIRREHRYLGYTSMEFRSLIFKILLTWLVRYMLIDLVQKITIYLSQGTQYRLEFVGSLVMALYLYDDHVLYGIFESYQGQSDMEKYYAQHLDNHFKGTDFGRKKPEKITDPALEEQAKENLQSKLHKYLEQSSSMQHRLLDKEEQQFTNNTGQDDTTIVPCFYNIQNTATMVCSVADEPDIQKQDYNLCSTVFQQFEVRNSKEEYGIITYEILYTKNDETKQTERSFLDLFIFIRTAQKKHRKNQTMKQLLTIQKNSENRPEVQKLQLFAEIIEIIQRNQDIIQEFGYFLEYENAHIWQKQFNLFLQSTLLDSFMIKSAFQHEEVEELLESQGIDLDINSIYINNFYFKPKAQAKIEFVIQTREGRSMFQRRNISEFQKIAGQIIKEKPLTPEQMKNLKKFSEQKIENLKSELEAQVNAVLKYKGPCKFKERLYKFLIG